MMKHVANRLFNTPHMIHEGKLEMIIEAAANRVSDLPVILSGAVDEVSVLNDPLMFEPEFGTYDYSRGMSVVGSVAVIPVSGTLVHKGAYIGSRSGMTSYEGLNQTLQGALDDNQIKHIVLNIHTGGGEVNGCFDFCDAVAEASQQKPITALVADAAFSAGYMIASAANEIVMTQAARVGSIGVVVTHLEISGALEQAGIKVTQIYAGDQKTLGSRFQPLSEEDQAVFQKDIDELYSRFVDKVSSNRSISADAIREVGAAVFYPDEAIKLGLADAVQSGQQLIDRLSGLSPSSGAGMRRVTSQSEDPEMGQHSDTATEAAAKEADTDTTVKAEEYQRGRKAGGAEQRERISAILNSEAAEGRSKLANHLALSTDMSVEDAIASLEQAEPEAKGGGLTQAMRTSDQPEVGAEAGASDSSDEDAERRRLAKSISSR